VARREARYRRGNGGTERSEPTHSPPPCPYWGKGVRPKRGAKGIVNIAYNYLNLPDEISFGGGKKLTFVYDAMGRKLSKRVYDGTSVEERSYFGGIEYRNGQLERVATSAGSVTKQQTASVAFRYEYVLSDHLGNTRAVISDLDDNGLLSVGSEVIQVNHYYPYGLNMQGPWNGSAGSYKYQYNGKELTDALNLNWNDYGARYYDAARIQWTGVDPLAEKYMAYGGYHYVMNNPVKFIDLEGRDNIIYLVALGGVDRTLKNHGTSLQSLVGEMNAFFSGAGVETRYVLVDPAQIKTLAKIDDNDYVQLLGNSKKDVLSFRNANQELNYIDDKNITEDLSDGDNSINPEIAEGLGNYSVIRMDHVTKVAKILGTSNDYLHTLSLVSLHAFGHNVAGGSHTSELLRLELAGIRDKINITNEMKKYNPYIYNTQITINDVFCNEFNAGFIKEMRDENTGRGSVDNRAKYFMYYENLTGTPASKEN
jgi:RHS repeat-associated protein